MLADKEGVLHVASRMVGSKVHLCEHMQIVLYFGTVCQDKAHSREDVDNLVGHDGQRMARTQSNGVGRTCQVDAFVVAFLSGTIFAQLVDALCSQRLQLVDLHADLFFLVSRYFAEIVHQERNLAFLTQVFKAQLLYFLSILRV